MDTSLWVLVGVVLLVAAALGFYFRRSSMFKLGKGIEASTKITIGDGPSEDLRIKHDRKTFSGPHGPGGGRDK